MIVHHHRFTGNASKRLCHISIQLPNESRFDAVLFFFLCVLVSDSVGKKMIKFLTLPDITKNTSKTFAAQPLAPAR